MLNLAQRRLTEGMTLFLYLLLCAFIGYVADRKGRNELAWGVAALFLSPLIVGIVLAVMPDEKGNGDSHSSQSSGEHWEDEGREEKRCPECGCLTDAGERYCPRCGEMLW